MKRFFSTLFIIAATCAFAASHTAKKTFAWSTDLKYSFMPKQKMTFINGVVKNTEATALPDIDAKYSNKVKIDDLTFTLPGELCETMSACYKADLNGDKVPDYVFVSVKVWNGRDAGTSDDGVFVSTPQKKYTFKAFEARHLEAEVINGKIMLIKYACSDDEVTLIKQVYTFSKAGGINLHLAEAQK